MKRFLSILMAVAMIAAVMLAFPAPANAFNYYVYELNEFQPYFEGIFITNGSPSTTEFDITVYYSGYYIIQTYGFPDCEHDESWPGYQIENTSMTLFNEDGDLEYETVSMSGYGYGCFMYVYLNSGEQYTVEVVCSHETRAVFSITYAENYFLDNTDSYYDIEASILGQGVICEFYFDWRNEYQALVRTVYVDEDGEWNVEVSGCGYEKVLLINPCGHHSSGFTFYELSDPDNGPFELEEDVLYYMVVYLDHCLYGLDAYFEDVQEILVQVTFG